MTESMQQDTDEQELARVRRELKERCDLVQSQLTAQSLATAEEIAAKLPGGEDNPYPPDSTLGWAVAYAGLFALLQREGEGNSAERRSQAEAVLLQSLSDQPAYAHVLKDGQRQPVAVYAKSYESLRWFDEAHRNIEWLTDKRNAALARAEKPRDVMPDVAAETAAIDRSLYLMDLSGRVADEVVFQHLLMAWAAVTEGPGLPWAPGEELDGAMPQWIRDLAPDDLLYIRKAFVEVNAARLRAVNDALTAKGKGGRIETSWATFFALRAEEAPGTPTSLFFRDRSLVSQLAAAALAGDAKLAASESPKPH